MKIQVKKKSIESLKPALLKITALLAFLVINLIGYRAFSKESSLKIDQMSHSQIEISTSTQAEVIPACQIAAEGYVEDKWKSVRIQIGHAIVEGAETISDLGSKLKQLALEHKCLPVPVPCSFATEGFALGSWVKHRVMVTDRIAFGGNTTARIFEQLGELKKIGICE